MKSTDDLLKELEHADTTSSLNTLLDHELTSGWESIAEYLNHKLEEYNLAKSEIISRSGIPRTYAYQLFQGIRQPSRDKLICLCLAMGLSYTETRQALAVAQLGALYPKRRRDAAIIFAINKGLSPDRANELLDELDQEILS